MHSRHSTLSGRFVRHGLFPLCMAALISFVACDDEDPTQTNMGPITTPGGGTGGPPAGTGGTTGSVAGTGGTGGVGADAGVGSPTGGSTGAGTPTGGGTGAGTPTGGTTSGAGNLDGGASPGGGADAGSDGSVTPTSDGGASAGGCTRELLKSTMDKLFVALAAHDASMLPLASNAKFTENGETLPMGMGGLWQTAGMLKYQHSALDVQTCNAVAEAVVPENGTDLPVGARIKLADGKVTEIELIVVREGDYTIFGLFPFPSNPGDIVASADRIKWTEPVTAAERTPRAEIERWFKKYFDMFPGGGCNLSDGCERRENGGGNFACSEGLSCASGEPTRMTDMSPRLIVFDEELGIGVAFVMFMGHTDFHMLKVRSGTIYAVHAILSAAENGPGWP